MVQSIPSASRSRTAVITAVAACAAAVAGVAAVLMIAFMSPGTTHAAAAAPHPAPQPAAATTPAKAATHPAPSHTTPAPAPHVVPLPAAQVTTIQKELASLNYYQGPVDGIMNAQTVQAITYLQRDAQLPQNGEWNQVTYLAMQRMLATGNNQMGS